MSTPKFRVTNPLELGRVLARIRATAGLSQGEMAKRIGIHRSYLARMENGLATEQLQRTFAVLREAGYELSTAEREDETDG